MLSIRILFVLFLFVLCRLIAVFYYHHQFSTYSVSEIINLLYLGIRSDISSIIYVNGIFIFLSVLPFVCIFHPIYRLLVGWVYCIFNGFALLINLADNLFFEYNNKRMTWIDVERYMKEANPLQTFQEGVKSYFVFFIVWILFIILLVFIFRLTNRYDAKMKKFKTHDYVYRFSLFFVVVFLSVVGARGGLASKRPISLGDPLQHAQQPFDAVILSNASFTILQSITSEKLKSVELVTNPSQYFNPIFNGQKNKAKHNNVVIIILESFSKRFTGIDQKKGYYSSHTPFLDSLAVVSVRCKYSFANGFTSSQALPAILAGIPSLGIDFLRSDYVLNDYPSLGKVLNQKGYHTSFFHGAHNGSMNFDDFTKKNNFTYFGLNEYDSKLPENLGHWGVHDMPFYSFFKDKIDTFKEPFITSIFTISSHHPFTLPLRFDTLAEYQNLSPIKKSIQYADLSLQTFFSQAKKSPWFQNTLFVIVADHIAPIASHDPYAKENENAIPILYFAQDLPPKVLPFVTQQIDILPSVLDYLAIDTTIYTFGKSIFREEKNRFSILYQGTYPYGWYHIHIADKQIKYDGNKTFSLEQTPKNQNFVIHDELKNKIKSFIQTYNHQLINNKMTVRNADHPNN